MVCMVEIKLKRQANNFLRVPDVLWNWLDVKQGEEVLLKDEEGKHGRYISFWKKDDETGR